MHGESLQDKGEGQCSRYVWNVTVGITGLHGACEIKKISVTVLLFLLVQKYKISIFFQSNQ